MEELLPLLMLLFIAVPTVISISQAKNKQQEQQKNRPAQTRQQAEEKKPDAVLRCSPRFMTTAACLTEASLPTTAPREPIRMITGLITKWICPVIIPRK